MKMPPNEKRAIVAANSHQPPNKQPVKQQQPNNQHSNAPRANNKTNSNNNSKIPVPVMAPPPVAPAPQRNNVVPTIAQPVVKKSNLKKPGNKSNADPPVFKPEVSHAPQTTTILASQSFQTNTVQNLLVGRPGEHIAENVLHLFREFYTDPAVMSRLPRQHQNDAVHRQLASFQRIVDEMEAHFSYSPSRFHAILLALVNEAPHIKNNLKLGKLKGIFEDRVKDAQKVTGYLRDTDRKTKSFFENYLTEILYHKRLRKYFCQRLYCPLYLYYYDEFDDMGEIDAGYMQEVEALVKQNRAGMKHRNKNQQGELAESDFVLNKKEYLLGNYKAINSWTEKRKLSYAVEHLFNLDKRWEALLDDVGSLSPEYFEPESSENMDQFNNYPAFEPILRLMPDLYVKTKKAVELATLWWTAGNKLFPANPDQMVERADTMARINEIRTRVERLTEELQSADVRTIPYQHDLDALLGRDDHFNRLAADYENLATLKREKLDRHQKLEDRANELESETPYWSRRRAVKQQQRVNMDVGDELKRVRGHMSKSYRSLRLVAYQFEITSGDYLAELTVRPTFVRFLDTCQQRLTLAEGEMGERRSELAKGQREFTTLMANYNRRRDILEKYMSIEQQPQGAEGRAAERNNEAIEKSQARLQHNDNNNSQGNNNNNKPNNLEQSVRKISPPSTRRNPQNQGQPAGQAVSNNAGQNQKNNTNRTNNNERVVVLRR